MLGKFFMFSFSITQTFFMQLGISIGRLIGQKTIKRIELLFPWLCLLIGLFYILMFINHLTPI